MLDRITTMFLFGMLGSVVVGCTVIFLQPQANVIVGLLFYSPGLLLIIGVVWSVAVRTMNRGKPLEEMNFMGSRVTIVISLWWFTIQNSILLIKL